MPDLTIDHSTGALQANASAPELVINSIQLGNADDLPQLGRHLLTSAYLMVNQDAGTYTFWEASLDTGDEDLVAVDETNKIVDKFCSAADSETRNITSPEQSSTSESEGNGLSKGAIAGVVVGSVAGVRSLLRWWSSLLSGQRRGGKSRVPASLHGITLKQRTRDTGLNLAGIIIMARNHQIICHMNSLENQSQGRYRNCQVSCGRGE